MLVALLPLHAAASDPPPKGEFFGGYSYFRTNAGTGANFNGANFSVAENANGWLGGALDVSTHWDSSVNLTTVMLGPVLSYRRNPGVTPFVHVLAGGVRGSVGYLDISKARATFGLATGGGLDARLSRNVALRLFQVDYIVSGFSGTHQNNIRLSAGLVLRFGSGPKW
jgi:opacity protein-like surface antigen